MINDLANEYIAHYQTGQLVEDRRAYLVDVVPEDVGVHTADGFQRHEGDVGHHPGRDQPAPLLQPAKHKGNVGLILVIKSR